jgi:Na+-driven multidrug efflux pump
MPSNLNKSAFFSGFNNIDLKLLLALMLTSLIPLLYSTIRIHFLGGLPNPWAFSIAAQVTWLNVVYEVLSEALLLPLAYVLGQVALQPTRYNIRISSGLAIVIAAYLMATIVVITFAPQFVAAMQQQTALISQTVSYIRLESVAILLSSVYAFSSLVLVLNNRQKLLYTLLLLQTVLTIIFDSLFVSQLPFSMNLGVNGIAWANIVVNAILSVVSIIFLTRQGLSIRNIRFTQQLWLVTWLRVGAKSGLESLVRNTAFVVMILQLINQVQQAGVFWLANQFIWGWLLLPILALGQLVKRDAATNNGLSKVQINRYMLLVFAVVLLWLVSMAGWQPFIENIMGVSQSKVVVELTMLMLIFYIVFSFNHVIDSYFYGIGRTDLMLYQSLIVNIFYYGSAFAAYQMGWFVPSLNKIAIMFGIGMTIDAIITAYLYFQLTKACHPNMTNTLAHDNK